jgi:hypothetical protein
MIGPHVVCEDLHGALMVTGNRQKQGATQTQAAIAQDSGDTMEICHLSNTDRFAAAEERP